MQLFLAPQHNSHLLYGMLTAGMPAILYTIHYRVLYAKVCSGKISKVYNDDRLKPDFGSK